MELSIPQKKKHLLLLNRIIRAEIKKDIIPTPSKLTESDVNSYFNKLFVKKDDYYVPIKTKMDIKIDESKFIGLIKKPKMKAPKKEKMKEPIKEVMKVEEKKQEPEDMVKTAADFFIVKFINPYLKISKAGGDANKEKMMMIKRFVKFGKPVKDNIKSRWAKLYASILSPADEETEPKNELKGDTKITSHYLQDIKISEDIKLLDKKELVKELIKEPEEIIKKGQFEYDKNYFDSFELIERSDRGVKKDEEKLKIKMMLERLQFQYDLYTTPKHCIDTIFNNILNDKDLHNDKINILEPSAGTGRFIRYIIDNKSKLNINDLDAVEYSFDLYNLLKDKVKIDNVYNKDFLYFDNNKKYNLIIMNPPYRGTVSGINEPEYYKYHLIKAMILNKNIKTIYLISPNLSSSSKEPIGSNINLNLNNALLKRVNKFFKFDFENDMPNYKILKIGECDGFIKYTKNGTTKMQQSFNIYKINIK